MNKSFSKIRHIQEANEKLEKRFLTEEKTAVVKPEVTVTPQVPSNLGFGIKDCPIGVPMDYQTNRVYPTGVASTQIIIKPGAKITIVKKGDKDGRGFQATVPGLMYFRKDGKKAGEKVTDDNEIPAGPESTQGLRGKSIPKTIWFEWPGTNFYVWYDSIKVEYGQSNENMAAKLSDNQFNKTLDWFGQKLLGYATQADLISAFEVD